MFTAVDVVSVTKMDASNLSMVFAPNFMRCPSKVNYKYIYKYVQIYITNTIDNS